jgi:hypothetical protein
MENNFACLHCGRDVRMFGTEHYEDDQGRKICSDCGVAEPSQKPEVAEQHPTNQPPIDISAFQAAIPQVLTERLRQRIKLGYGLEHDMRHSLADFSIYIEKYLAHMKRKLASRDPQEVANARNDLIKIVALGFAYLESHPQAVNPFME